MAELVAVSALRERLVVGQLLSRESDRLYNEGEPARLAALAHTTRPRIDRPQVLRLAAIADQMSSVSTLLDHIKQQTGKRPEWRQEEFGRRLLHSLAVLQIDAEQLARQAQAAGAATDDPDLSRRLYLELCRRFLRHLAAAYVLGPATSPSARAPEMTRPAQLAATTRPVTPAREPGGRGGNGSRRVGPPPEERGEHRPARQPVQTGEAARATTGVLPRSNDMPESPADSAAAAPILGSATAVDQEPHPALEPDTSSDSQADQALTPKTSLGDAPSAPEATAMQIHDGVKSPEATTVPIDEEAPHTSEAPILPPASHSGAGVDPTGSVEHSATAERPEQGA